MFAFIKIMEQLLMPPSVIVLGLVVVLVLWKRRDQAARTLLTVTIGALYLVSIEPTAFFLSRSLAQFSSLVPGSISDIDAIVVLAGGATSLRNAPRAELNGSSFKRLWHGLEHQRAFNNRVPLVYSGGSGDPFERTSEEARLAKSYAVFSGAPEEQVWIEEHSRNTTESADAVAALLQKRLMRLSPRVLLVTSETHLLRSKRTFERAGLTVIPAPADHIPSLHIDVMSFIPSHASLSLSVTVLHEWIGIVWYDLRGIV